MVREPAFRFADHLAAYGPNAHCTGVGLEAARVYTRDLATSHYENFTVVSGLLPRRIRQHFANVYAYCRWSDDLADEIADVDESLRLLDWWQAQLDRCYDGQAYHPVFVALAETIEKFKIPKDPFANLLTAFRSDRKKLRYADFPELRHYCRNSADPVGRIVLYLAEAFTDENAIYSDYVCTGLQLANFWQDVGIDVDKGRIYLPEDVRTRFGVTEEAILAKRFEPSLADALAFEVERAMDFLRAGLPLATNMPRGFRLPVAMFAEGGLAILAKIRKNDFNVFDRRPKLSKWDYWKVAWNAWWRPKFEDRFDG